MPKRILAIGAHPDDIEFGCGGVVAKEAKQGNVLKFLILSLGEAGSNGAPEERKTEAKNAAKIMGAEIKFLNFGGDCHITHTPQNAFAIARHIRQFKPDIVLAPESIENQHPDHTAVGKLTRDAVRFARYGALTELKKFKPHKISNLYHFPSTPNMQRRPDILVDVTEVADTWQKAMEAHKSQVSHKRYIEIILSMSRWFGLSINTEYACGLYVNDPIALEHISDLDKSSRNF